MAIKYFDLNGSTAGFGTLTGAWATTGAAFWTDSSAGTNVPANYTFTSADTAAFGFAGTTATAGTATISTGVAVTLNKITTANLAGMQTIAAGGTGTLNLVLDGATVPSINVGSAGGLTISAPITGTAGFTKAGTGLLSLTNAAGTNTITGQISVTGAGGLSGALTLGTGTTFVNPTQILPGSAGVYPSVNVALENDYVRIFSTGTAVTFQNQFSGFGAVNVTTNTSSPSGPNFAAGTLSGLTGTGNFSGTGGSAFQTSGLVLQPNGQTTANNNISSSPDLPATLGYLTRADGASVTGTFKYTGSLASPLLQKILLSCYAGTTNLATSTFSLEANQLNLADAPLNISSGIKRANDFGGNMTFTLAGTHAGNNTVSGAITSDSSGTLGIAKAGTGRWILSGANSYTGTTSISAGTLSAQNASAFGSTSAGDVTMTGGMLEVAGGITLNKAGRAFTLISAAGANALSSPSGTNTINCAGITLSSTAIVDVASGSSLTLGNTAAMAGSGFGITKNNSGELALGTFANTYTGAVTINAGTLTINNLQNSGTASSLGTGAGTSAIVLSGTLKYVGPGTQSTNRSITFTGPNPTLDASPSLAAVTYTACTQAAGARTITFTGTSTHGNALSANLSDGTGAVSVAKSGTGKWVLSGATVNYTGTTTVSDGTLNLGSANRVLSGTVTVSGGVLENGSSTLSANVVMTGGTITAELTGNKTLDVNSGSATLQPDNNGNTYTGATTVSAGAVLRLLTNADPTTVGAGKVLGNSAVSVSGQMQTSAAGLQRGQMRYGGNVTFNSNSQLHIGGA